MLEAVGAIENLRLEKNSVQYSSLDPKPENMVDDYSDREQNGFDESDPLFIHEGERPREVFTRVMSVVEGAEAKKFYIENGEKKFRMKYGDAYANRVLYLFDAEMEYEDTLNLEEGDLREAVERTQYRMETIAAKEYFFDNGEEAFRRKYGDEFSDEVLEYFKIEKEIIESEGNS